MNWEEIYKKETGKDATYETWISDSYGGYDTKHSDSYVGWLEEYLDKFNSPKKGKENE